MGKRWRHFKTICRHKAAVFHECKACGLFWQGLIHDLSKFSLTEFESSARYFQGDRSPIEAEKECCGYSLAWQHHKGHNPHHWEYWTDYGENGEIIAQKTFTRGGKQDRIKLESFPFFAPLIRRLWTLCNSSMDFGSAESAVIFSLPYPLLLISPAILWFDSPV